MLQLNEKMKIAQKGYLRTAIAAFALANIYAVSISESSHAQIVPDATLPNVSVVVDTNPLFTITGGTTAGTNLLHSFTQFSVPSLTEAFFDNPLTIQNILVRVTGTSSSNIDGVISANGNANLFLINPNGIIFERNARLNIGGSFLGTTANSVRFLDGQEYRADATTQTTSPLLLVSVPVGLQFNGLTNGAIAASVRPSLSVPIGKTLALVGGDVTLQGAFLRAESGRIEIGSVAGNGFVAIAQTANDLILNYDQAPILGNILLEQAARASTIGNLGGSIQLQGSQIILEDNSLIRAISLGDESGGNIFVKATELFSAREPTSGLYAGGNITVNSKRVELINGGRIAAGTVRSGKAGDIRVNASEILINGKFMLTPSAIYSGAFVRGASGDNGNIIITTNNLLLGDNAQISFETDGIGRGGNIEITAQNITLIDTVNRNNPEPIGVTTGISSGVSDGASGNGGNIKINTDNLQMTGVTLLTTSTSGSGNAGKIDITAKSIVLDNNSSYFKPSISSGTFPSSTGNGGDIKITADRLVIKDGGSVESSTFSIGNAGNLLINAKLIDISGSNLTDQSGLFANALVGTGNGGNIEVNSDRLILRDRGIISASNFPTQQVGTDSSLIGKGTVGSITINSPSIFLDQGNINIDSASGSRGNVNVNSNLILLRNSSSISTNALGNATGGNIRLNTDFLVAVPSENSDITANSVNNFGGKVDITARGVIGFQLINRLTPLSDITATSSLGTQFNGLVEIRAPNSDFSRGLVKLPENLTDANKQIVTACDRLRGNEFIVTGRGGTPADASKISSSQAIWRDLRFAEIPSNATIQTTSHQVVPQPDSPANIQPIPQLEAHGWERNAKGNLKLLAYAALPSESVWRLPVICPANPFQ